MYPDRIPSKETTRAANKKALLTSAIHIRCFFRLGLILKNQFCTLKECKKGFVLLSQEVFHEHFSLVL